MAEDTIDAPVETVEPEPRTENGEKKERLDLAVDIADTGPCKKHLRVTVPQQQVQKFFDKEFSELVKSAAVPGFRPGKTPRKLIERRFRKDVAGQVKGALLMQSLEQIGDEQKLEPLSEPHLDVNAIELPDQGDFVYEFDIEVRPTFDLPDYHGLRLTKPVREVTEKEVEDGVHNLLRRFGTLQPKDGGVEKGDYVSADVRFMSGKSVVSELDDQLVRVDDELLFRDGKIADFAKQMEGAKAGESRDLMLTLADSVENEELRGKQLDVIVVVDQVQTLLMPALDKDFYSRIGVGDMGELRDLVRSMQERRQRLQQTESLREQVVEHLLKSVKFDLPIDLVRRQAERTLRRRLVELQDAGYGEEEISTQLNALRQDSVATTASALRQSFILQAIAEKEDIDVDEDDYEAELTAMAQRADESVRKVRARLEKDGLADVVMANVRDRKTLDRVISFAQVTEAAAKSAPKSAATTSNLDVQIVPSAPPPKPETAKS